MGLPKTDRQARLERESARAERQGAGRDAQRTPRHRALSGRQWLRAEARAAAALRRGDASRSCSATARTTCSSWRPGRSRRRARGGVFAACVRRLSARRRRRAGARGIVVPAADFGHDLKRWPAAIRDRHARGVHRQPEQSRPALMSCPSSEAFLARCRRRAVVLDEAYNEYLPDRRSAATHRVARALSESGRHAHVLQGLWSGRFARRLRICASRGGRPDEPRAPAVQREQRRAGRGATARSDDDEFVARSYGLNVRGMAQLRDGFERLGLACIPSLGNFLALRVGALPRCYSDC